MKDCRLMRAGDRGYVSSSRFRTLCDVLYLAGDVLRAQQETNASLRLRDSQNLGRVLGQ
jgi:hypothetical protein